MRETASGGRRGTHLLNILCGSIAGIFFKYLAEILWIIAESHRPGNSFDIVIMIVHHKADGLFHPLFVMGRIDPVEYVGVSQQRNGDVRNINHPLCGCAVIVIQKITFPSIIEVSKPL